VRRLRAADVNHVSGPQAELRLARTAVATTLRRPGVVRSPPRWLIGWYIDMAATDTFVRPSDGGRWKEP
jgi:hypothetical protein